MNKFDMSKEDKDRKAQKILLLQKDLSRLKRAYVKPRPFFIEKKVKNLETLIANELKWSPWSTIAEIKKYKEIR